MAAKSSHPDIIWGIDGSVSGHAGAYISFTLGPYVGTPDEAEIQSTIIGLGELMACHGQYVTHAQVSAVKYIGVHNFDRIRQAAKAVAPDEAREENEDYWRHLDEYVRAAVKHADTHPRPPL